MTFEELRLKYKSRYDITESEGLYTLIDYWFDISGQEVLKNVPLEEVVEYLEEE